MATVLAAMWILPNCARAQSPELAMREFSSGQIKKGVRSIGFGGDGATWGNYGLVWLDAGTALFDVADTHYTNGNDFHFEAVGVTSPSLWHHLAIYAIAMFQDTNNVQFNARSPGLGRAAVPLKGSGSDDAVFIKIAMPLAKGFSAGVLLSHETSEFDAVAGSGQAVHYGTQWRPSGGFGVAWQPSKKLLFGFRLLSNNDLERRTDAAGLMEGAANTLELRLGGSVSPWHGALIDLGGTRVDRRNSLARTQVVVFHPNVGFEQSLLGKVLTLRFGLDETSPTAGGSVKVSRLKIDAAYVRNMAKSRVGNLFGPDSNSLLVTVNFDYRKRPPAPKN